VQYSQFFLKYAILYADIKLAFANNKHEIKQYFIERDEEDIKEIIKKHNTNSVFLIFTLPFIFYFPYL